MILEVKSKTDVTKTYEIDTIALTCTCPQYKFRLAKVGGICKHLHDVLDKVSIDNNSAMMQFIVKNNDALAFIDKFGEETLELLKTQGEVYEKRGRLYLLV